ncbi:VOC family protein [Nocardia sp. 348MFTsu5.1]|uniref:VOC family protein n=1 Tax=Nocardia sp. 348MFTsu5.1 TaxID=1172185 RepID=UPI00037A8C18|nr:VOC family protein [Nocardia sp. 348MFTsu5.1]
MGNEPRFAFTKIFVDDLDAEAHFYTITFGMGEKARLKFGEGKDALEEIILTTARDDDSNVILWRYLERPTPPAGEATLGFTVSNVAEIVRRAEVGGGSIIQPPKTIPEAGVEMAFITDPEGHVLEVVQYL